MFLILPLLVEKVIKFISGLFWRLFLLFLPKMDLQK